MHLINKIQNLLFQWADNFKNKKTSELSFILKNAILKAMETVVSDNLLIANQRGGNFAGDISTWLRRSISLKSQ
jgi:hypothetical protein